MRAAPDGQAPFVSFAQASDSGKARVVLAGAQAVSKAGDCEDMARRDEPDARCDAE